MGRQARALASAERNRNFEINLYWRRSAYFWAFNAFAFVGYGALSINLAPNDPRLQELTFLLSNMGFVASVAWFLVNKGSKYWQEYWETQVEELENYVIGPLYKSTFARIKRIDHTLDPCEQCVCRFKQFITDAPTVPSCDSDEIEKLPIPSVSKINQLGSAYISSVWLFLVLKNNPWTSDRIPDSCYPVIFVLLTAATVWAFIGWGKTKLRSYSFCEGNRRVARKERAR